MSDDREEDQTQTFSVPYLAFTFVVGIGITFAIAYAGYRGWSPLIAIGIGAVAQTVFRVIKRTWVNSFREADSRSVNGDKSLASYVLLALGAMIVVSAIWYYVGKAFGSLLS